MLDKVKKSKILQGFMNMKRLHKFLCVFDLRQGTIVIATHQITVSAFVLLFHLVGISHLGEMLSMLHNDMNDDAERRGFTEISYGGKVAFHEGDGISNNNQKQFAKAQHLASETVIILYTSTVLTTIYGLCSVLLLYGAVKSQRGLVVPWIVASSVTTAFVTAVLVSGLAYSCVMDHVGGRKYYYMIFATYLLASLYSLGTVCSFALERNTCECMVEDERGEQLLLLDQTAQSSLLSVKQLDKLSLSSTTTHFV